MLTPLGFFRAVPGFITGFIRSPFTWFVGFLISILLDASHFAIVIRCGKERTYLLRYHGITTQSSGDAASAFRDLPSHCSRP